MLWIGKLHMWLTNFNLHNCKVLSFGIQVNIKNTLLYSMSCSGEDHQLDGIEEENDLGVLFNTSLKLLTILTKYT